MAWELAVIKARHKCMIDLHLAGLKNTQIAEEMDCTPESIGMVFRSPIVQQEIARRRNSLDKKVDEATANTVAQAKQILETAAKDAAGLLVEQMSHEDPRVAQNAALSILEETFGKGSSAPRAVVNINVEQLAVLQTALSESRA